MKEAVGTKEMLQRLKRPETLFHPVQHSRDWLHTLVTPVIQRTSLVVSYMQLAQQEVMKKGHVFLISVSILLAMIKCTYAIPITSLLTSHVAIRTSNLIKSKRVVLYVPIS